jgi:phosphate transport system substrate-binding protein
MPLWGRFAASLVLGGSMTACGSASHSTGMVAEAAAPTIRVDGSSTVFPISEAVAEEFQKAHAGARVTVGVSGTGGGFQKFCRGETDVNNASRPIRPTEIEACRAAGIEFIEMPVAYDGLAVVVNRRNTWAASITVDELRRLWAPEAQGKVTRWSQVRTSWPDREIHLFGAGVDSGTYDYFTQAVVGAEGASRGDFTSSEDDNVIVQGVAGDELALGFLPLAYVAQNQAVLTVVSVDDGNADNGNGPIVPSAVTIRNGTYQPLARPLFVYVARAAADRPVVQAFVDEYFTSTDLLRELGYVELTPQLYALARQHFADRKVSTAFGAGGSQVGLTLDALRDREQ